MKLGWAIVAGTILLVTAAAWLYWTPASPDAGLPDVHAGQASETALLPPVAVGPPPAGVEVQDDAAAEPALDLAAQWVAVKRFCPWPPDVSSWTVLDESCLSAMGAINLDADPEWRVVMTDPSGTRRAVVTALDDAQCHVPPGETRPDLYEVCAAEAMVRLARLQRKCLPRAHMDWEEELARAGALDERFAALEGGGSQEEYIRDTEEKHTQHAHVLWSVHMCRSATDALGWLEAIPRPPGNLANAGLEVYDPRFEGREDIINTGETEIDDQGNVAAVTFVEYAAPRLTQDVELFALARRLGAKLPDWADRMLDVHEPTVEQPGTKSDGDQNKRAHPGSTSEPF